MPLVTEKSILSNILKPESIESKESNVPKIMSSATPYVRTIVDSEKTPSPIEILHIKGTSRTGRFPLAEYYAQGKGKGRLGYRNNDVTGFDQPFVIRDIGQRWGFDKIELGDTAFINAAEKVVNSTFGLLNEVGESILGRNPNEYIGYGLGSLQRMGKFLGTPQGIAFLVKQYVFMRRNKQKFRTDVKYGLADDTMEISSIGDLTKRIENPRLYNPFSLGSLPGVTKININFPDPTLIVTPYTDTVADLLSDQAKAYTSNVAKTTVEGWEKSLSDWGRKTFKSSANSVDKLKKDLKKVDDKRKAFNELSADVKGKLSKRAGLSINPNVKALSSIGVDRVNLIPYGPRDKANYNGKTEEELDFVPFRFKDSSGNIIVFRALLSGITDTFTPEYSSERYVGRPDQVHVYQGTNREISFTFDIYPKSDLELPILWEKMNYLAGLTYPEWAKANGGGMGMIAPFCKLTIGDMYRDASGYISALTYTVQDNGTWETTMAKLPKYIQASCTFVYIGDRLPSKDQKHYDVTWLPDVKYTDQDLLGDVFGVVEGGLNLLGAKGTAAFVGEQRKAIKSLPGF